MAELYIWYSSHFLIYVMFVSHLICYLATCHPAWGVSECSSNPILSQVAPMTLITWPCGVPDMCIWCTAMAHPVSFSSWMCRCCPKLMYCGFSSLSQRGHGVICTLGYSEEHRKLYQRHMNNQVYEWTLWLIWTRSEMNLGEDWERGQVIRPAIPRYNVESGSNPSW